MDIFIDLRNLLRDFLKVLTFGRKELWYPMALNKISVTSQMM